MLFCEVAFRRHPPFFRELSSSFYIHFILLGQLIVEWFATLSFKLFGLFRHSLTASATVLSGHFLSTGVFYLTLLPHISARFVTQMWAGTPHSGLSSVPALTKLSLQAEAWSCTAHVLDTRPFVYQLCQWTRKVTKLLNISYAYSKSYGKDYNQDLLISTA